MKSLGFVLFLAACGFKSTAGEGPVDGNPNVTPDADNGGGGGGGGSDASTDAFVAPPDGTACFGRGLVKLCLDVTPTGDKTLTGNIDTGNAASCTKTIPQSAGSPELCVIAANNLIVSSNVTATGARALVLVAATTIDIQSGGTIDVSSRITNPARKGAAASTGSCAGNTAKGGNDSGGGGGGGGGGFGSVGGRGGVGDSNDNGQPNGSAMPSAAGTQQAAPTTLRGGCAGSAGGAATNGGTGSGGAGGEGGGAVYLIAGSQIKLTGSIYASGAAGGADNSGNGKREGGGGGGAGGMIVLDAPSIDGGGKLVANGGGGGGGGSAVNGGAQGGDGTTDAYTTRASAGVGDVYSGGNGGNGAKGAAGNDVSQIEGGVSEGGGGGGGGGTGVIWTYGTVTGALSSPPATAK